MTDRSKELIEIVERFPGKRIAVVGDLILDEFIWGDVRRISPEAPVPIVEVVRESIAPGGAANVAMNLASLGALPILAGLIGNDFAGRQLIKVLSDADINCKNIIRDKDRNTTLKTRIIAHHQQVCRTDQPDQHRHQQPPQDGGPLLAGGDQAKQALALAHGEEAPSQVPEGQVGQGKQGFVIDGQAEGEPRS